ncbi:MAG: hypothetical protein R3C27_01620 [Hyphomonadaceae bacterium]
MSAETTPAPVQSYTIGEGFKDLGWFFWTFALVVAGPSVLSIMQAVFVEHQLIAALQWIVDGYNGIFEVLGSVFEPLVQPLIDWVNAKLRLALELQPHWKPLFVLVTMLTGTIVRLSLTAKSNFITLFSMTMATIGTLVGAIVAGLAPLTGGWWVQGLAAAAPIAGLFAGGAAAGFAASLFKAKKPPQTAQQRQSQRQALRLLFSVPVWLFVIAAGLSFAPGLSSGAGAITLAAGIFLIGAISIALGVFAEVMERQRPSASGPGMVRGAYRFGLTLIGGFVVAGLILAADTFLRSMAIA